MIGTEMQAPAKISKLRVVLVIKSDLLVLLKVAAKPGVVQTGLDVGVN